ncbi:hypothetical protein [Catenovulum adriaticum]|uniref:Uncharacterized protein n=1 Tax=Catenovulum adriaticum TaxID=2984846 RepID=A0ABY7AIM0_9ALTE|nr:hypothetical protein [Catenovulum sp. TS8]WAJ69092.1 hypothetical protein OLW01_07760 [Catenovulum sp. TS8]
MSQDLLIPFLPRVVQNKLERPRLNVKRIVKEPRVSEDAHQSETQQEVYEQNNLVVAKRVQSQAGATRSDRRDPADSNDSAEEQLTDEESTNKQLVNDSSANESKNKVDKPTEADMAFQIHTVRTKQEIEQALAKQEAFEHPVYEKDEILHPEKHKSDSPSVGTKSDKDDDYHVDIIV